VRGRGCLGVLIMAVVSAGARIRHVKYLFLGIKKAIFDFDDDALLVELHSTVAGKH
jgi:hypothetical protein